MKINTLVKMSRKWNERFHPFLFVIILILMIQLSGIRLFAQSCIYQSDAHMVTEYGSFTADLTDSTTISHNNTTINNAINTLGKEGGGIVCLPAGTFFIGPDPNISDRAITIAFDNITICGAGVGKTILKTNGTWNTEKHRRGHGIIIKGTSSKSNPRKNIILKDFELDGQDGWTGNYKWTPPATSGKDGWDISHKGIVPSWDANTDNITLENLYVHHYRGEILYIGGLGMGMLTVRNVKMANTNGSDFNLYADDLLVENCEFGGPSRFWIEYCNRQSSLISPKNRAIFRNNVFKDAKLNGSAIVFTQGDFNTYSVIFEGNTISDAISCFAFDGGVKGPIRIVNNTISNLPGNIMEFHVYPGWINNNNNANITMENNIITGGGVLVNFSGPAQNVVVRNNNFTGNYSNDSSSTVVKYGSGAPLSSNLFEANTFSNCRTPEEDYNKPFSGERPLFQNNIYTNVKEADNQAIFWLTSSAPKVTPHNEHVQVFSGTANFLAQLETNGYPSGQKITVTGGSTSCPVLFAVGQESYSVSHNRYLNGSNTLYFSFDVIQKKWVEVEQIK